MNQRGIILIADDAEINRAVLRVMFEDSYSIVEAENGEQALALIRQFGSKLSLVLLDLMMPKMDGYSVLEQMHRDPAASQIPVIVITAEDSADSKVRVFKNGAADIITKPFESEVVKSRVGNVTELWNYRRRLEGLVEEQSVQMREANAAIIDMLSSVVEYRSLESGQHIHRIRLFTKILLEELAKNYPEYGLTPAKIQMISEASALHDIGKIAIPDSILNKPGKLTPEEFEIMKTHTLRGCEMIAGLGRIKGQEYITYAYDICRYHHERWNGEGYPDGKKGGAIPISAHAVAVADCFDALTTDRVYKKAIPPETAFNMILNGQCGSFSPNLLECLKAAKGRVIQLAAEYADNKSGELTRKTSFEPDSPLSDLSENVLEQTRLRYLAMLKYSETTAIEADLDTGVYHMVYLADRDFSELGKGKLLDDALRRFAEDRVHPDDRAEIVSKLGGYYRRLFEGGVARKDREYRVADRYSGEYVNCRETAICLYFENTALHKLLLLWRKLPVSDGSEAANGGAAGAGWAIEDLLGGTLRCGCGRGLGIIELNESLVAISGYSGREIAERFHNRFAEMIYPADRDKTIKSLTRQGESSHIEIEFRLIAKSGRWAWVRAVGSVEIADGEECLACALIDVSEAHLAADQLRALLERYDVAARQANDIIFDWDITSDSLYFSTENGSWENSDIKMEEILSSGSIYPEDVTALRGIAEAYRNGAPVTEAEFRVLDAGGAYRWRKALATMQYDSDGKPLKAIGTIRDIDSQKQQFAGLEDRAARDSLTNLYNRAAAQDRIEKALSERTGSEICALLVIDIDDFKSVNDDFGHSFGDAALVDIANRISQMFRGGDIVARVGGDEFVAFLPGLHSKRIAEYRAGEILKTLQSMANETTKEMKFSCSIGIAFADRPDISFRELFNHADRALYRAKEEGKNRYVSYEKGIGAAGAQPPESPRTENPSPAKKKAALPDPGAIIRAADELFGRKTGDAAISAAISALCSVCGADRLYIFETDPGGETCSLTCEWCAPGISPRINEYKNIPYKIEDCDFRDLFGRDGIYNCANTSAVSEQQIAEFKRVGLLRTLHSAMFDGDWFAGFIGVEDSRSHTEWGSSQIEALNLVAKLISLYLLKTRAQQTGVKE